MSSPTVTVHHNKVALALHPVREGEGRPLLHLHGLGERSPATVPAHLAAWPGPVWALDFTGHGASTVPVGGGYSCELLMADADAALAHLGPSTLYGRGLGAYVALLTAGARPTLVRGAILDDGTGLTGGGAEPPTPMVVRVPLPVSGPPDPYALVELSDTCAADYAANTTGRRALSGLTWRSCRRGVRSLAGGRRRERASLGAARAAPRPSCDRSPPCTTTRGAGREGWSPPRRGRSARRRGDEAMNHSRRPGAEQLIGASRTTRRNGDVMTDSSTAYDTATSSHRGRHRRGGGVRSRTRDAASAVSQSGP